MWNLEGPVSLFDLGQNWRGAYRLANRLIEAGIPVYWALEPFTAEGQTYPAGAFLLPEQPRATEAARSLQVELFRLTQAPGVRAQQLKQPRIALYGGGGAPYNHAVALAELGFPVAFVHDQQIRAGALDGYDVLIFPGGALRAMQGQLDPLGDEGTTAVANFVRRGGMYLSSCAGSVDASIAAEVFTKACPCQLKMRLINAKVWNSGDAWGGLESPGIGVYMAKNLRPDHPVMFGLPEQFPMVHYNGPIFELVEGVVEGASLAAGLTSVAGVTGRFTASERFMIPGHPDSLGGLEAAPADPDTLIGRAQQQGHFTVVAGHLGLGKVVLAGSHPEFGPNLAMDQWERPMAIFANAILWQSAQAPVEPVPTAAPAAGALGIKAALSRLSGQVDAVRSRLAEAAAIPVESAAWLASQYSMSSFGLSPQGVWKLALEEIDRLAGEAQADLERLAPLVSAAPAGPLADRLNAALAALAEAIVYSRPAEWQQDVGYHGIQWLLATAEEMLSRAVANQSVELPPPSGFPYDYFFENPYHQVAGSYLSAMGVMGAAVAVIRIHRSRLEHLLAAGPLVNR